jgi:hypothetical protein
VESVVSPVVPLAPAVLVLARLAPLVSVVISSTVISASPLVRLVLTSMRLVVSPALPPVPLVLSLLPLALPASPEPPCTRALATPPVPLELRATGRIAIPLHRSARPLQSTTISSSQLLRVVGIMALVPPVSLAMSLATVASMVIGSKTTQLTVLLLLS